ncbi:MAG: HAMP domain-containing sensor histidine kinase, partial [Raoultibacter sp.]
VLSFVWEQHFQAYTRDNLQKQADNVAVSIATKYTNNGGDLRRDGTLSPAESATSLNSGLGIQVIAGGFDPVNESILYDNTRAADGEGGVSLAPSSRANVVSSPIIAEGTTVGTVRMWVPGSELMLSKGDVMFREQSYQAMIFAAALAIALALGIGFLFARGLVNPINRMTKTAKDIKKGNLSARTGLTGDDEVARLGETFDEMAESIEKDRELERRLTTDVAHELRTPLMAIQSTVEAMVDGVFEANAERLETVNSEVQRLGRLVEALLKLSRLENRSSPMSKEVIDVGDLISGIIATHEAFVADSGLTLRYEREDDVFVCGDADMLRQATANLISNAVRYTPEGGTITVKVTKGDLMACIVVQDTGIGLSPEEIKMVFSRFWRADAGRDRASGGLGIGLAVVKEIVDRHGGWVRVEGKLDEGACFTIYVPLYNEETAKNREKMKFKNKNAS